MSSKHSYTHRREFEPPEINTVDSDLSGGWKEVFGHNHAETSIELEESTPDPLRILAANRSNRPPRYRWKHRDGRTS